MPDTNRQTSAPIEAVFTDRWSPRAFDESLMSDADVARLFEAARWAPSAFNAHFYAKREQPHWQQFVDFLAEWAQRASLLIMVCSQTDSPRSDGTRSPNGSHAFDTASAWMSLALQATHMGYVTHGMGGVHRDKIKEELGLPDNIAVHCGVAVGTMDPMDVLSEKLQQRETPADRMAVDSFAVAGGYDLLP